MTDPPPTRDSPDAELPLKLAEYYMDIVKQRESLFLQQARYFITAMFAIWGLCGVILSEKTKGVEDDREKIVFSLLVLAFIFCVVALGVMKQLFSYVQEHRDKRAFFEEQMWRPWPGKLDGMTTVRPGRVWNAMRILFIVAAGFNLGSAIVLYVTRF